MQTSELIKQEHDLKEQKRLKVDARNERGEKRRKLEVVVRNEQEEGQKRLKVVVEKGEVERKDVQQKEEARIAIQKKQEIDYSVIKLGKATPSVTIVNHSIRDSIVTTTA